MFNGLFIALLGIITLAIAVMVPYSIQRNYRHGLGFRERLLARAEKLRISRMLKALGVDTDACLHQAPVVEIEQNLRNCEGCQDTEICDDALQSANLEIREVSFCPNQACFEKYVPSEKTPQAVAVGG
ncbi:MAG: DUF6455 family protein [Pseudomonadota bacterium]